MKNTKLILIIFLTGFILLASDSMALESPIDLFAPSLPDIQNIGTTIPSLTGVPKLTEINLGGGSWDILKGGNVSSNDLTGALKAIAVLAINLFLIVIQVVVGILKALLPFLSS